MVIGAEAAAVTPISLPLVAVRSHCSLPAAPLVLPRIPDCHAPVSDMVSRCSDYRQWSRLACSISMAS